MNRVFGLIEKWEGGYTSQDDIDPDDYKWLMDEAVRMRAALVNIAENAKGIEQRAISALLEQKHPSDNDVTICPYCQGDLGTTISNPMKCPQCLKEVFWSVVSDSLTPITKGHHAANILVVPPTDQS